MKAGRKEKKVYLYSNKGKFIKEYPNSATFCKEFDAPKNLLSANHGKYVFPDSGNVASWKKIGKIGVLKLHKYLKSTFVGNGKAIAKSAYENNNKGEVVVRDLDGDIIVIFNSLFSAIKILGRNTSMTTMKPGDTVTINNELVVTLLPYKSSRELDSIKAKANVLDEIYHEWEENWDLVVDFFGQETADAIDKAMGYNP